MSNTGEAQPVPTPAEDLAAWRKRTQTFIEYRDGPRYWPDDAPVDLEMDVDDMIGAKGRKLASTQAELDQAATANVNEETGEHGPLWTPNANVVRNATRDADEPFPETYEEGQGHEDHMDVTVKPLLGLIAGRIADESWQRLGAAIDGLREPVRSVAIHHLYLGHGTQESAEKTARALGTSVETVTFLADIALDMLATHLRFE
jgi:hypothetical protein